MMSALLQARIKELLDTLMAEIRPLPSEHSRLDFSYRLNSDAFILQKHAGMVFTSELTDVMATTRLAAGVTQPPVSFDMAG